MIREKHTKSGKLFEADFYPIWENGNKMPVRAPKTQLSTIAQQRYNDIMAIKKFVRLANANFDNTDYLLHPTYRPECAPQDEKQARKEMVNFIRRIKTKRASELKAAQKVLKEAEEALAKSPRNKFLLKSILELKRKIRKLEQPFKYIYVIEKQIYKTGKYAGCINWHFHLFISGGLDSKTIEGMWKNGVRTNCNHFQPEKFGPEAAAVYMSKDPQGAKRFVYSRNLKKPTVSKPKDGRITPRGVEKLAMLRVDDREYWEKRYKGYRFLRCYARFNAYNGHWYLSVVMYKTDETPPEWKCAEWLTEDY